MEETKVVEIGKNEKKSEVITFSDSTFKLLINIGNEMKNMQDKVDIIISTVISEKGNPEMRYTLAPDNKSLLPRKEDERDS